MILYFHPLYILVIKILYSIPISLALIHHLYHPLSIVGPLVTLSKYIHVRSSFEEFIETNLLVQSEFNLIFWFMSYNIFCYQKTVGPVLSLLSPTLSRMQVAEEHEAAENSARTGVSHGLQYPTADCFHAKSLSCRHSGSYSAPSAARLTISTFVCRSSFRH
jgi:hypothetical protein